MTDEYLTVSELTKYLKAKFVRDPYLQTVYLTGEVSNFHRRPKHQYFSLKDDRATIKAIMWAGNFSKLKFDLEEGMNVLAIGRIDLYEPNGNYSIVIEHLEPAGIGALYQTMLKLKEKLTQEGLFAEKNKQPLPRFPRQIAVLTSPSGAVIRDIITTVKRRFPIVKLVLFPTIVQGADSAPSIIENIKKVEAFGNFDLMIIARGGGSIEDLWSFNEEEVVRAVFAAKTPTISSIGHETDTTLVDYVADIRAATPTAAAELATPVLADLLLDLQEQKTSLVLNFQRILRQNQDRLTRSQNSYIFQDPTRLYQSLALKLDLVSNKLINNFVAILKEQQAKVSKLATSLDLLSPLKTMGRGFIYTTKGQNTKILKSVQELELDEVINLHYLDGKVKATVTEISAT